MLKKVSIVLLATASMVRPTAVLSAELRETFLNECSEQAYQERVRDKKLISAVALKIVGYIPKECLKRFDEVKRYLVMENNDYLGSSLGDAEYRSLINRGLDARPSDGSFTTELSRQEEMRNVRGKTTGDEPIDSARGFTTISPETK